MVNRTRNPTTDKDKTAAAKAARATKSPAAPAKAEGRTRTAPKRRKTGAAPAQRERLIAEAAYYIAQRRGFSPGNELDDWLQAEREVDLRIGGSMH